METDRPGAVLIVEDNPPMAALMRMLLVAAGFDVVLAGTGAQGMSWLQSASDPALVILDLNLPDTDGLTLIGKARRHSASVPILMVTSESDTRDTALAAGANAHLYKPFHNEELVACVQQLTQLDRTA